MIFDPIANMISALKNGYRANKDVVEVLHSKHKENILKVLVSEKMVEKIEIKSDKKTGMKNIAISLSYTDRKPAMSDIKQVSKPSRRVYVPCDKLPKVLGGLGFSVISTPSGVVSSKEAKKKHLGGEVICNVW